MSARKLILLTLAYNVGEGAVALWAAVAAGSVALAAFGADSYLEVGAASVVLWRLSLSGDHAERVEEFAERFIGVTFLLLSAGIVFQGGYSLWRGDGAEESFAGITLAIASLVVMPGIAIWKLKLAARHDIRSLASEARETLACSYLSLTLLLGLVANALIGWWWLDPVTALLLLPWLVREGLERVRPDNDNEDEAERRLCACRSCLYGVRRCHASCCVGVAA
ncbi:MAG: cation transporter [Dehalococcoidia bacterium]|jgi:divalent metal cation (Fe/Co/Zn/Cd) transporter|nr:cation transporter [Dehalococcoidia bacterium]